MLFFSLQFFAGTIFLRYRCVTLLRENDSKFQEFIFVLAVFVIRFRIQALRQAFVTVMYVHNDFGYWPRIQLKNRYCEFKFCSRQRKRERQRLEHNKNNNNNNIDENNSSSSSNSRIQLTK